ncbi:MAG: NYN domain-containing protein [Micrococcales bacterium]
MFKLFRRQSKRIGVYIDGFNLYYGMRDTFGRGTPGWRWLDVASLSDAIAQRHTRASKVAKITYCTALRTRPNDETSVADQTAYLETLSIDKRVEVVHGNYVEVSGKGILLSGHRNKSRKFLKLSLTEEMPIPDWLHHKIVINERGEKHLLINYDGFTEKRTDVNLASILLKDIYTKKVDEVIVISNDGDLKLPLDFARSIVRVILVNPQPRSLAKALVGENSEGVGGHIWLNLDSELIMQNQFAERFSSTKPTGW